MPVATDGINNVSAGKLDLPMAVCNAARNVCFEIYRCQAEAGKIRRLACSFYPLFLSFAVRTPLRTCTRKCKAGGCRSRVRGRKSIHRGRVAVCAREHETPESGSISNRSEQTRTGSDLDSHVISGCSGIPEFCKLHGKLDPGGSGCSLGLI